MATRSDERHLVEHATSATGHGDKAPSRPSNADDQSVPRSAAGPNRCAAAPHRSAPAPPDRAAWESDEDDSNDPPPTPMNVALLAKRRDSDATNDVPSQATRSASLRPA